MIVKKKILIIILSICLSCSVIFGTDIALSVTPGSLITGTNYQPGAHVTVGTKIGLTPRIELGLDAMTEVVPNPFGSFRYCLYFGYDLLGPRYFRNGNAGFAINSVLNIGVAGLNTLVPDTVFIKFSPVTIGMVAQERREHLFPFGIGYDFINKEFCFWVSVVSYDFYI